MRTAIGLEAYGQRDPLVQYKSRAFDMFQNLLSSIRAGLISGLFRVVQSAPRAATPAPAELAEPEGNGDSGAGSAKKRRRRRR